MESGYIYLDELNSNSKAYSVKVKVVEKARAKPTSKKGILYQGLLLVDDKGNKIRGALFGDQVESFNDAIVYNGEYVISNAPIKLIAEQWRSNSGELPYQMTFGGQTVVRPANSEMPVAGPIFQSIHTIPRIMISESKYDVVGIVLFVEDKLRIINTSQGREFRVREIVLTDHTNTQPLTVTAWNDLAGIACDALSVCVKNFAVVGFTALRPSLHKGFSLSTGMSTQIIHDPKGEKEDILREWAKVHTQQLIDRQEKIVQVRSQTTNEITSNIQSLREKKAHNVLQEERHWLQITIAEPDLDNVIAYIGCSNCGRRTDIPVGTEFMCTGCKKASISSYRVTFKFEAVDDTGAMTFTTFNNDTEKLFGKTAHEIHAIKDSGDAQNFLAIEHRLRTIHISVQIGPTTALSRNNVLEWCLKGIEISTKSKKNGEIDSAKQENCVANVHLPSSSKTYDHNNPANEESTYYAMHSSKFNPVDTYIASVSVAKEAVHVSPALSVEKPFEITDNVCNIESSKYVTQTGPIRQKDHQITGIPSENELLIHSVGNPQKRSFTEVGKIRSSNDAQNLIAFLPDKVHKNVTHTITDDTMISEMAADEARTNTDSQVKQGSAALKRQDISVKQEHSVKKVNEFSVTRGTRKKRSLNALVTGTEVSGMEKQGNSEDEYQGMVTKTPNAEAHEEKIDHSDSSGKSVQ